MCGFTDNDAYLLIQKKYQQNIVQPEHTKNADTDCLEASQQGYTFGHYNISENRLSMDVSGTVLFVCSNDKKLPPTYVMITI